MYLDSLNDAGQIDIDDHGSPIVFKVERTGKNYMVGIVRNQRLENFIINPRSRQDPVLSWNPGDGYIRKGRRSIPINPDEPKDRRERRKRTMEAMEQLVDTLF